MRQGLPQANTDREDTYLTRIVTITTRDGRKFHYTEASSDVVLLTPDATFEVYRSRPGLTVSNIRGSVEGNKQSAQIQLGYDDRFITQLMVRKGDLDGATHRISVVDQRNPNAGAMLIFAGGVDAVTATNQFYCSLDVSDWGGAVVMVGEVYSLKCRNVFGDKRCKVDKEALAFEFTVTEVGLDGVHFRTDVPAAPVPEQPPTEHTEGSETYSTPGTYSFTVPQADLLVVDIAGGGGAGGAPARYFPGDPVANIPPKYLSGVDVGLSGETSYFGDYIEAKGGEPGQPNPGRPFVLNDGDTTEVENSNAPAVLTKPGKAKAGSVVYTLTLIDYSAISAEGEPNGAAAATPTQPGTNFREAEGGDGGNGGRMVRTFKPGTGDSPAVGAVIEVVVGDGGDRGGAPSNISKGGPGYVKITYSGNVAVPQGEYNNGDIEWLTGRNKGDVSGITTSYDGIIALVVPPNYPIRVGDKGRFKPGCSNYAPMCENRYNNLKNMQAEPAVPTGVSTAAPVTVGTNADSTKPKRDPEQVVSSPGSNYPPIG